MDMGRCGNMTCIVFPSSVIFCEKRIIRLKTQKWTILFKWHSQLHCSRFRLPQNLYESRDKDSKGQFWYLIDISPLACCLCNLYTAITFYLEIVNNGNVQHYLFFFTFPFLHLESTTELHFTWPIQFPLCCQLQFGM